MFNQKKFTIGSITISAIAVASLTAVILVKHNKASEEAPSLKIVNKSNYVNNDTIKIVKSKMLNGIKDKYFISNLNRVLIVDDGYGSTTGKSLNFESGYIPATDEIIFNTSLLKKMEFSSKYDQAEYIYELLFHEYYHFLNNHFLNNILPTDLSHYSNDIYKTISGDKVKQNWNKIFISEFKRQLNYDHETKKYKIKTITDNPHLSLISAKYSTKQLYDFSNSKSSLDLKIASNFVLSSETPDRRLQMGKRIITKAALKYIFSVSEMVARKMQIVDMKYVPSGSFKNDGWIITKDKEIPSPYLEDILNYADSIKAKHVFSNDKPTTKLRDIYSKYINPHSHISYLEYLNNQNIDSSGTVKGVYDRTKVRFGGWMSSFDGIEIGYLKNNKFVNLSIKISGNNYELKEPIDIARVLDKKLVVKSTHGYSPLLKNNEQLKEVSTYKSWDKSKNNYKIESKNGLTRIVKI